jgi:Holliday junction DNA helicase RuvA
MIAYISGDITYKNPTYVYLEAGGIGYHINISLNTYSKIENLSKVKIFTHLNIKEDSHTLYGFFEEDEKELFILLISVSGIGPNTARIILSSMEPDQVRYAILQEDVATFNKVKGIGPKTAKRIILDLKDKVMKSGKEIVLTDIGVNNTIQNEALQALVALGFHKSNSDKILSKILKDRPETSSVEELIKLALSQLR